MIQNLKSYLQELYFLTPLFRTIFSAIFLHYNILKSKNITTLILVSFGIYIVNKRQNISNEDEFFS